MVNTGFPRESANPFHKQQSDIEIHRGLGRCQLGAVLRSRMTRAESGDVTRGVNLADASPEMAVVGSRVPILLIHGLADDNIPFQQSERIRAHNPAEIVLWEVPNAGHCGAVNAAGQEFDTRVLGWFTSHDNGYGTPPPRS